MNNNAGKYVATAEELEQNNIYTDRKTVKRIENKEGEVYLIDNVNFGIRSQDKEAVPLLPCNLPQPLQRAGIKIIFSGLIKETGLAEFWAAQPFVLTSVREK